VDSMLCGVFLSPDVTLSGHHPTKMNTLYYSSSLLVGGPDDLQAVEISACIFCTSLAA
jgi:hypothetical protein